MWHVKLPKAMLPTRGLYLLLECMGKFLVHDANECYGQGKFFCSGIND